MNKYKIMNALIFLWCLFMVIFIGLCLKSCKYEKATTPDSEFVKVGFFSNDNETRTSTDTVKWQKE